MDNIQVIFINAKLVSVHGSKTFLTIQNLNGGLVSLVPNNLTWIDNLITGSGKNLASSSHKNNKMPYVQDYIARFGIRKCEANSIVPMPNEAAELVETAIIKYLGKEAIDRFNDRRKEIQIEMDKIREKAGLNETLNNAIKLIDSLE